MPKKNTITMSEWAKTVSDELEAAAKLYQPKHKPWTDDEDAVVLKFYCRVPIELLAKKLRRTISSVRCRSKLLQAQNR